MFLFITVDEFNYFIKRVRPPEGALRQLPDLKSRLRDPFKMFHNLIQHF